MASRHSGGGRDMTMDDCTYTHTHTHNHNRYCNRINALQEALDKIQTLLHKYKCDVGGGDVTTTTMIEDIGDVEYVPGLINEILLETSKSTPTLTSKSKSTSASTSTSTPTRSIKKYSRTVAMTELLLSVVLNFTRCFLQSLPPLSSSSSNETSSLGQNQNHNHSSSADASASASASASTSNRKRSNQGHRKESEERLLDWVSDILLDLLVLDPTAGRIPVLDALLATTGSHNGMSHDACLQDIILASVVDDHDRIVVDIDIDNDIDIDIDEHNNRGDDNLNLRRMFREPMDCSTDLLVHNVIDPQYVCKRMMQSPSNVEVDDTTDTAKGICTGKSKEGASTGSSKGTGVNTDGEEFERLCSDNLFLGQMQSFLNAHNNDEPLYPLFQNI